MTYLYVKHCLLLIMTSGEKVQQKFKSIRVPDATYHQLLQLTSMYSLIASDKFSISQTTANIVSLFFEKTLPDLEGIVQDPDKIRHTRLDYHQDSKKLIDLMRNVKDAIEP